MYMKAEDKPLVSVIIPTFNRSEWLIEAVSSVLNQTYDNIEILVIDDGSDEKIYDLEILHNKKILYFKNTNHGVAYSRNFGLKKASGKYVAFLDSDDFWDKRKLEIQISKLEKTGYKWSQHNYYYYDDCTKRIIDKIDTFQYRACYEEAQFCSFKVQTSCFVVDRRAVIDNNCYFDETKTYGEDTEFFLKMMKLFPLQFIDEYLSYFRIRGNNAGKDVKKQLKSRAVFWKDHKEDLYVKEHMSIYVILAYKWCVLFENTILNESNLFCKMVYFFPWILFKYESRRLIKRQNISIG